MENCKKKDQNFISVLTVFNKNAIPYWVCHGTLLGIIRDKELIEWDHDIDIGVLFDHVSVKEIINLMTKEGFKIRDDYGTFGLHTDTISFTRKGGRIVDINFYKISKEDTGEEFFHVRWGTPKNNLMKLVDALSMADTYAGKYKKLINSFSLFKFFFKILKIILIRIKLFYKITGYSEPANLIIAPKIIYFQGLEVKIPIESEKYLHYIYGNEWKIPNKNYIWHKDGKSLI